MEKFEPVTGFVWIFREDYKGEGSTRAYGTFSEAMTALKECKRESDGHQDEPSEWIMERLHGTQFLGLFNNDSLLETLTIDRVLVGGTSEEDMDHGKWTIRDNTVGETIDVFASIEAARAYLPTLKANDPGHDFGIIEIATATEETSS
jgi:hypothetical protein